MILYRARLVGSDRSNPFAGQQRRDVPFTLSVADFKQAGKGADVVKKAGAFEVKFRLECVRLVEPHDPPTWSAQRISDYWATLAARSEERRDRPRPDLT